MTQSKIKLHSPKKLAQQLKAQQQTTSGQAQTVSSANGFAIT